AGSLFACGRSRQLVGVDTLWVDAGCGERIQLLIQGLMAGGYPCVAELNAGGAGGGCGHGTSMSQKSQKHKICDKVFEATFATWGRGGFCDARRPTLPVSQL